MKVLGIDPGTHFTGWAVIEGNRQEASLMDAGVIKPKQKLPLAERFFFIFTEFGKILEKFHPDAVACETPFLQKDPQALANLSGVWAIVSVVSKKAGVKFSDYSPLEVKKTTCGWGRASKEQVQDQIKRIFNLTSDRKIPLDASDAIACAFCYISDMRNYD